MSIIVLAAIFFVVWWIVLFAVLPWGVRTQEEDGEVTMGTTRSAPVHPHLVGKAIATTVVSGVVVFGIWLAIDVYGFGLAWLAETFDMRP